MIQALKNAIITKAVTISGISASNLFYVQAPDGKSGMYVVYSGVPYEKQWDSMAQFYPVPVQFNFYGPVEATVQTAVEAFEAVMDFATLTVSGYTFIHCIPTVPNLSSTKVDNVWQSVLTYMIEISKLRS